MPKRRTTILGLGALAMGSGAAFTSAAFQNSAEADADFRVVVDQQLVVSGNDDPGDNVTVDGVGDAEVSDPTDYLFGGDGVLNEDNISFGEVVSDGEAAVNGEENEDLQVALAVTADEDGAFDRILEVQNEGETDEDVGITIAVYGEDVSENGDTEGSPIEENDVDSAFTFKIDGEEVGSDEFESVEAGEDKDISIGLDLGEINESDLRDAADPGSPGSGDGDVFGDDGAAVDTVDLVEAIEIGIDGQD